MTARTVPARRGPCAGGSATVGPVVQDGGVVRRASIARVLLLALVGLTVALGAVAALAVASLYDARRDYEGELARSYAGESAAAALVSAGVVEETVLRAGGAAPARAQARRSYASAVGAARRTVAGSPARARLLDRALAGQRGLRRAAAAPAARRAAALRRADRGARTGRRAAAALADAQGGRRVAAQDRATDRSRKALLTAGGAGILALLGAVGLVAALVTSLRRPLDSLVQATGRLAAGDFEARVEPDGPAELRDLSGAFNTMAGQLETARERVEAARQRLSTTIESLGDGLLICDGRGRVQEVNPRARELVPELPPGTDLKGLPGPLPPLADALEREVGIDHGGRHLTVTAARMGADLAEGVVFTVRDSTERVQLERAKSDFVATASHELRSPLTSIKGFVELLAAGELPDRQREFVDIVLLSTNRLVDLVNDLLDVARVEAGQMEIQCRPTALGDVVTEVATLLDPRLQSRRQALAVEVDPDLPAAWADPARVRQILTNLLTNAHLYTPEGGDIEVRLRAEADDLVLTVADSGRGMTAEQLEHAFDRFYRVDGTAAAGTGLGLPIVRSLVELHDGSIDLDSELGRGTTATVRLPRALGAAELSEPHQALRGRRVLIVDDEPEIGRLIGELLAEQDVSVATAHSGGEALRRLRAARYDAVTLDVLLGDRDGLDVLREIREDADLRQVPVVVVSVRAGTDPLPGEWSVTKPIDPRALVDAIGSAILAARARVLVIASGEAADAAAADLQPRGVDFAVAADADEAAELAAQRHFEIAIVDRALGEAEEVAAGVELRGRRLRTGIGSFDPSGAPGTGAAAAVVQALRTATSVGAAG